MLRPHPRVPLILVLLSLVVAQEASAQLQTGNVHVYVTSPDDRPLTEQLKVDLISGANQVAETFTSDHGQAQFSGVIIGTYHMVVSGQSIQTTESDTFEVDARKASQSIFVRVRPAKENGETNSSGAGGPTVSTSDLRVPKNASKEFDKAQKLIATQQWQKAIDRLNKALALYPNYAQAYTNLGVVYARLGDVSKEREALQKAIAANDHFAPAFVNLAQMEMKLHNFAAAEEDLNKATSTDPTDVRTLVLLAQAQLMNAHYEDVIASARKVHTMSHAPFPQVHYVAARACERLNRFPEAISQLKLFLAEEPSGARAAAATQEMAAIQKQLP